MLISARVRDKLKQADHNVTEPEILECFANRDRSDLIDNRAWHVTNPSTRWFVAETDRGRQLKVCYILHPDGIVEIKSAYPATAQVREIYEKYAK